MRGKRRLLCAVKNVIGGLVFRGTNSVSGALGTRKEGEMPYVGTI